MIAVGLGVGLLVGALGAFVAASVVRRRREAAMSDVLDDIGPPRSEVDDPPTDDLLGRMRETGSRLVGSLARSEADVIRLEHALDRMVDGVIVCDVDGEVVFTNTAGAAVADGRHEDSIVAAAVIECLGEAVSGTTSRRSVELFGPPARIMTVEAHPLGPADRRVGAVASITDESRLRRLEAVRSDFVANVSHELKTPVGGLALLAEALADADESERERLAERLHLEAHRVGRVIDDLLALSEIESDLPPDRVQMSLGDLIDRVDAEVALLAEGLGVEIDLSGVDRSLAVVGDPVRLTSALTNLVENALKYSGGRSPVQVWAKGGQATVRVGVTDRGLGIPRQDLDRVFERFYRVDQARSRATGGTGLGLAIVRNVIQAHGGDVEVVSREGVGSTFTIVLPRDAGDRRAPAVAAPARGERERR